MKKLTWENGWECHYGSPESTATVVIDGDYDLNSDYENPRSHVAMFRNGHKTRVIIDHDATGTATAGTGDTCVRSIPRGWRSGDRDYAN